MLATTSNATTDDPAIDAEIATVRHALDRSLDEKWDHFRTDFRELWGQFQTECIESSHKLVVAEKAAADGRYAVLKDAYDKVKAKCADVDRYNQLLQEKLDHVQAEMKSLSAVSMTIQWEKRVASKQAECERLTKQLETQKQVNTTLKRENTLLNTQLEQWSDAREAEAVRKAKEATEAEAAEAAGKAKDATEAAATAAAKAVDATEAATMAAAKAMDATEAAATAEATNNTDASSTSPAATEAPKAETEAAATSLVDVEASNPVTKPPTVALETEQAAVASEPTPTAEAAETTETAAPEDDAAVTSSTAPEPMTFSEPAEAVAPEPAPPATPTTTPVDPPAPPAITYTLKKLKRKKADTEKTPFLLGSDDVLYAWTEGDVPGAAVGTKTARGYKFTKK
jgi:DNA polymerase III gamma/tau subunit